MDWLNGYWSAISHVMALQGLFPDWEKVAAIASAMAACMTFWVSRQVAHNGQIQFLIANRTALRSEALEHFRWVSKIGSKVEEYDELLSDLKKSDHPKKDTFLKRLRDIMSELNALAISAHEPAKLIILSSHNVEKIDDFERVSSDLHREQVRIEAIVNSLHQKLAVIMMEFYGMKSDGKGGFLEA